MQKNYFMKNVLAASMLLTGTSTMISCQGLVDAIVGDAGQPAATTPTTTPTTPETKPEIKNVTLTTQGAQVNASSAAEVNTALAALAKDISEKGVGEGKEYTLEITSDVFNAGDVENINVPQVEGATINVVIKTPFTKPTTLVFGKTTAAATRGVAMTRDDSEGEPPADMMYITLPETVNEVYPTFEFQREGSTIEMQSTNNNSIINVKDVSSGSGIVSIKEGVLINSYKWTPGPSQYLRCFKNFINLYSTEPEETFINGIMMLGMHPSGVYVNELEILPSDAVANLVFGANRFKKMIIADGVTVTSKRQGVVGDIGPQAEVIESKGTSTVLTDAASTTISYTTAKGINFGTTSTETPTKLTVSGPSLEKCSTNYSQVVVYAPEQTTDRNSYEMTFDGCDFAAGELFGITVNYRDYQNNKEYTFDNYSITVNFKNCKIGDAALTASNLVVSPSIDPTVFLKFDGKINVYCVIDGTKYKVTWSKINGENCTLTPVA